jgi:hypothetical protein
VRFVERRGRFSFTAHALLRRCNFYTSHTWRSEAVATDETIHPRIILGAHPIRQAEVAKFGPWATRETLAATVKAEHDVIWLNVPTRRKVTICEKFLCLDKKRGLRPEAKQSSDLNTIKINDAPVSKSLLTMHIV